MFAEFDKVVRCLALELPEPVHADVVAKYGKLKAEVEKFTSTNNARDEIAALADELDDFNSRCVAPYGRITEIVAKMRQLSPVA